MAEHTSLLRNADNDGVVLGHNCAKDDVSMGNSNNTIIGVNDGDNDHLRNSCHLHDDVGFGNSWLQTNTFHITNSRYLTILKQNRYVVFMALCLVVLVMAFSRSVNFVLIVRLSTQMKHYGYFLSSILIPTMSNIVYWPIAWFKMFGTRSVTKEMRKFPIYRFVIMGFLTNLANLILVIASANVSGSVNVAMNQTIIINNMIVSMIFLSVRYNILQFGGVFIVIIGVILNVLPLFLSGGKAGGNSTEWIWALVLLLSTFFQAIANVYIEHYLKKEKLDVFYMVAWIELFQLLFGILFFLPFLLIPWNSKSIVKSVFDLPNYMLFSLKCVVGMNSLKGDICDGVYWVAILFEVFNVLFNVTQLVVFKHGSSTLAMIAQTSRLVMSNLFFMIPFLAGPAYQHKFSNMDIESLFILVSGIILYSVTKERTLSTNPLLESLSKAWISVKARIGKPSASK